MIPASRSAHLPLLATEVQEGWTTPLDDGLPLTRLGIRLDHQMPGRLLTEDFDGPVGPPDAEDPLLPVVLPVEQRSPGPGWWLLELGQWPRSVPGRIVDPDQTIAAVVGVGDDPVPGLRIGIHRDGLQIGGITYAKHLVGAEPRTGPRWGDRDAGAAGGGTASGSLRLNALRKRHQFRPRAQARRLIARGIRLDDKV